MNKIFILSFLLVGIFLQGCSNEQIPKQWVISYIQKPGESNKDIISTLIDDKTLLLLSPQSHGKQVVMVTSKEMLQGDFTASFRYKDLDLNAPGMGLVVSLVPNSTPEMTFYGGIFYPLTLKGVTSSRTLLAGTGEMHDAGIITTSSSLSDKKEQQTTRTGTISIERMGQKVTVTVAPDGEAPLSYTDSMLSTDPIRIGIQFGNFANTEPSDVSMVRVTNFSVTGGGGTVQNDHFTENTLE